MDLTGDIEEQEEENKKAPKAKKVFPTKNLLGNVGVEQKSSIVEEPKMEMVIPAKKQGRRGRKPAFEGVETEDKFFTLPKTTTRLIGLAKLDLGYKTEQEFVNDAIVELAKRRGLI